MSEHTCNYIDTRLGITEADTSPKQMMRKRPVNCYRCTCSMVCVCVCVWLMDTTVSPTRTAESIEMLFGA